MENKDKLNNPLPLKSLLLLYSYHHHNTEKIAKVFAKVLDAEIKTPNQVDPEKLQDYDLLGFGSGIYSGKHHESLLELADKLPKLSNKKSFIFSTFGAPIVLVKGEQFEELVVKNHSTIKEKLQSKGYIIVDEFSCAGFNTNSFLKLFGGINKGRPNTEDLKNAEKFAKNLKELSES